MFDTLEGFSFNGQCLWDSKEIMQTNLNSLSPTLELTNFYPDALVNSEGSSSSPLKACLEFAVHPENRFRYRYDTEMSGTHGSLQGVKSGSEKSLITVKLLNYPHEAFIRISLVTCRGNSEYYPHPHSLFVKEKFYVKKNYYTWDKKTLTKTGHYSDPHYIKVGTGKNDYAARFVGMCVISTKKDNFLSTVREKLQMRSFEEKHGVQKNASPPPDDSEEFAKKVETAVSFVDVDFVSLCFEAFREENGTLFPICPPLYSEPIGNAKSAKTGKIKISRINKCSGSCKGGDEIWMLVEKISKKGLVVRFSEECDGKVIWQSCIEGDDLILHHQYAMIFKTPQYRDINITSEVEVLMRLERTTQHSKPSDFSDPITFVYEPLKSKSNKGDNLSRKESILTPLKQNQIKRPRTELSECNYQSKRRPDDIEFENITFEEPPDGDIEHILLESKDCFEFDQAWSKFNVEDFLRFISSDDADMPLQKDGVSSQSNKLRREQLCKLYLLYSKLDENDIRKLTDQISNFRVSKKGSLESKNGLEKDQVKNAASTLLSLRSGPFITSINKAFTKARMKSKGNKGVNSSGGLLESNTQLGDLVLDGEGATDVPKVKLLKTKQTCPAEAYLLLDQEKKAKNSFECSSDDSLLVTGFNELDTMNVNLVACNPNEKLLQNESLQVIKTEVDTLGEHKIDMICQTLNDTGSWRHLAEIWDCAIVLPIAEKSPNPTKFIFEHVTQSQSYLELELLRDLLDTINEKKALSVLEEILSEKYT